jgi:4'-phosphopantetheinyl transferase EntD
MAPRKKTKKAAARRKADPEFLAMRQCATHAAKIQTSLEPLEGTAQDRVLEYISRRFGYSITFTGK